MIIRPHNMTRHRYPLAIADTHDVEIFECRQAVNSLYGYRWKAAVGAKIVRSVSIKIYPIGGLADDVSFVDFRDIVLLPDSDLLARQRVN